MGALSHRSPSQLERLARLQAFGGWLVAVGLAISLAAIGLIVLSERQPLALLTGPAALSLGSALLLLLVVAGALLTVLGLGLYLVVPGLDAQLARRGYDRLPTVLASLGAVFVIGNLLSVPVVLGVSGARALPPGALVAAMLATQAAMMLVLIWRVVRPGVLTWDDMGLVTSHLDRRLLQGVVGGLGLFLVAGVTGLVMRALGVQQTQSEMFEGILGASPSQFFAFWLTAAVVAPICEEAFFRGYVFTALRGRYGRPVAYALSAVLFAAIHFNLPALLPILVMSLCLAFLYDRSGSIVPGIVAHGLNNSVALTLLYAGLPT